MTRWVSLVAVLGAALSLPGVSSAMAADDPALCAEADARYSKLGLPAAADGVIVVKMYKYRFCPSRVDIAPGATVRWVNVERTSHNAWLKEAGQAEPDRLFQGDSWEFTFTQPGSYPYLCGPHGGQEGMTGMVVVK